MSTQHFVYINSRRLLLVRQQRARLSLVATLARSDDGDGGRDAFVRLIRQYRRDIFTFVVDSVDEELTIEDLPPVNARDLKALMARRIEQRSRERRLISWRQVGRQPWWKRHTQTTPTPQRVQLALLGPDSGLQPWLRLALEAGALVREVTTPALLAAGLAPRLGRDARTGLLVTVQPDGLRQTLLVDGMVKFSRLAQFSDSGPDSGSIVAECARTVQYLLMNQMLARDQLTPDGARVWIVTDGVVDPEGLPSRLAADSASAIEIRSLRATDLGAARVIGDPSAALGACALWLGSRLLADAGKGYATPEIGRALSQHRTRQTILAGAGSLAIASIAALLLVELWIVATLGSAGDPLAVRREQEMQRLNALIARHPVAGPDMRRVVEADARLARRAFDPAPVLAGLARATEAVPDVQLVQLAWRREGAPTDDNQAGLAGTGSGTLAPTTAASAPLAPPLAAVGGAFASATPATPPRETLTFELKGRIVPVRSTIEANRIAQRYVERIAAACACEARLVTPPFDPAATVGFSGSARNQAANGLAEFQVAFTVATPADAPQTAGEARDGRAG